MRLSRFLAIFTTLLLASSLSAHDFEVDGIYYNKTSVNTVSVTYRGSYYDSYSDEYTGSVIIPKSITYSSVTYIVTSIGSYTFSGCSGLTTVTIPNSVTSIGSYTFSGCSGLTSVTIPNSVTSIGTYAFYYCSGLTSVTIPNSVTSIGDYAFYNCSGLTSVTIPNSVTSIGDYTFLGCSGLTTVTIPNSVTSIGSYAFYYCSGLTTVTIPNSVTSIGSSAFDGCSGLTSVTIPNSVTSIGDYAFSGCSGLTSVTIPNSVTSIGSSAFSVCSGLTSVTIPNSVTSIGDYTFLGCSGLTSVTIPNSVTSIGYAAFYGCSSLTSVTIPNSVTSISDGAFYNCYGLTSVTIPNSVTSIGSRAFYGCSCLTSLRIEEGETELSLYSSNSYYYPFENCKIEKLYVGRNLSSWEALCNSSSLYEVEIGNTVTSIGSSAFLGCTNLYEVIFDNESVIESWVNIYPNHEVWAYVPSSEYMTTNNMIHVVVFQEKFNEDGLTYFKVDNNQYFVGQADGTLPATVQFKAGTYRVSKYLINGHNEVQSVICPNSLVELPDLPRSLRSVTVGQNVTSFSYRSDNIYCKYFMLPNTQPSNFTSFNENPIIYTATDSYGNMTMTNLSSIFEVDGIRYIPVSLSERTCKAVDIIYEHGRQSYTVPANVTYRNITFNVVGVGDGLFAGSEADEFNIEIETPLIPRAYYYECENVKEYTIQEFVTSIGDAAFYKTGISSLIIPSSVASIGNYAFADCAGLTSLQIEDSETELSLSSGYYHFQNCQIENLYVGRNLSSWQALCNTSKLQEVQIGGYVTSIGTRAFSNCTGLTEVSLLDGSELLSCESGTFSASPIERVLIGRNISSPIFREKTALKTAWISDIVTSVPSYMFYHCSALENLYVGDGVTTISDWAFSGCYNLKLFNFGRHIMHIGENALSDCSGLVDIYAEPMTPPTVYVQGLDDINKWECTLHYPQGAPYDTANQWKEFIFSDNDFAITLDQTEIKAKAGTKFSLKAVVTLQHSTYSPSDGIVWRSSNPQNASVDDDGNVTVHRELQATIAAFLPQGQMANCIVNGPEGPNISGVNNPTYDENAPQSFDEVDGTCLINVNSLSGMHIYTGLKDEMPTLHTGIYIVITPNATFKLAIP